MKNMKRHTRRMATAKKISQRKRLLFQKCGRPQWWSAYGQEWVSTWEPRTYNRMKTQFPFTGDRRREREEFIWIPKDKRIVQGDEGWDGEIPQETLCIGCKSIMVHQKENWCDRCKSCLDDMVYDNLYDVEEMP